MKRKQLGLILKEKYDRYTNEIIIKIKELDATSMLSGDDSNLENVWEEFAFQIQVEHSIFFEHYEELIFQIINDLLKSIDISEMKLLWLGTDGYYDIDDEELDKDGFPYLNDITENVNGEIYSRILIKAEMESLSFEHDEDEEVDDNP